MYKSSEGKAGCKWVLDKGNVKNKVKLSPIVIDKRRVYSYILEKYIPTTIQEVLSAQGGRVKHTELAHLSQKEICADVHFSVTNQVTVLIFKHGKNELMQHPNLQIKLKS